MLRSVCTRLGGVTGGASSAKVCVTGVDGKVHISFPEDIERSILLRVGGPHPQTVLFEQHGAGVFVALFKLCEAGEYTLHVRRLVDNPWEVSPLPSMGNRSSWTSCAIFDERAILVQRHTLRFNGAKKPCLLGLWHYSGVNDTLHLAARDEALGEIRLAPNEKWSECTAHGPFLNVQGPQGDRSVVESNCVSVRQPHCTGYSSHTVAPLSVAGRRWGDKQFTARLADFAHPERDFFFPRPLKKS